jgi:hypothetical protein
MATSTMTPEVADDKKQRTRSPAYPYINLETAITRAREFHKEERGNAANISVAGKHWGYKENSSGAYQTAAALISFGLMTDEGTGEKRKLRLTPSAIRILLDADPNSTERDRLIREAALGPKIHQELWKRWGKDLPSVPSLKNTLLFDWKPPFNENAVDGFIKEYKDTITFAKLLGSGTVAQEVEGSNDKEPYVAQIGDWVQWEHNGLLGFPEPKRVKGLSPDGTYAYVDGQNGAVPRNELFRESAPANLPDQKPIYRQPPIKPGMQEFVVPLSDGSRAVFQWPTQLSQEDVVDLQDSLKILERKITRSVTDRNSEPAPE